VVPSVEVGPLGLLGRSDLECFQDLALFRRRSHLGAGESQVLAFASENPGWEAALDDLDARRCAASLGIPLTGTLGVILRAKEADLIPAARPCVEELVLVGAHLSDALVERALSLVGES